MTPVVHPAGFGSYVVIDLDSRRILGDYTNERDAEAGLARIVERRRVAEQIETTIALDANERAIAARGNEYAVEVWAGGGWARRSTAKTLARAIWCVAFDRVVRACRRRLVAEGVVLVELGAGESWEVERAA